MRLSWLLLPAVVAALAFEAHADVHRHEQTVPPLVSLNDIKDSDIKDSDIKNKEATITPAAALELLPPGVRSPATEPVGSLQRVTTEHNGSYLVERIPTDADSWLDVEYTIDPDLNDRVRGVLERGGVSLGHVILLDPSSGEVFAYVSTDPVRFSATRTYPTASLMKVVTASAVLHDAPAAAEANCRYRGSPYRVRRDQLKAPLRGGRVDSFERSLAISNNQCFGRLAIDHVGERRLLSEMERTGLLEVPGFHHAAGRVEPIENPLDLAYLGSGLAGSFISPLGASRLAAMLARGELVTPYWVAAVRDADGKRLATLEHQEPRAVWTPEVADQLRGLMISVTSAGTAKRGFHDRRGRPLLGKIEVSGKTGTLDGSDPDGLYHWFIGVAPADDPQVAIATVVVSGKGRASSATQIAAATLREIFCDAQQCDKSKSDWLAARVETRREVEHALAAAAAAAARAAAAKAREAELARMFEAHELDQIPRPVGDPSIDLPIRLRRSKAKGTIVVLLELDRRGRISNAEIDSSDVPRFNQFVLGEVKSWRFTPPTQGGDPVQARTRLPLAIRVN